jgi:hypothetical protein
MEAGDARAKGVRELSLESDSSGRSVLLPLGRMDKRHDFLASLDSPPPNTPTTQHPALQSPPKERREARGTFSGRIRPLLRRPLLPLLIVD